jgi:hypothetical protein
LSLKTPIMSSEEEEQIEKAEESEEKAEEPEENDQKGTKRQKPDPNTRESDGDIGGDGDIVGDGDDDENDSFKIKSRREANRLHALKSRQRSKQLLSDLQTTVGKLKSDKQDLERQNSILLAQVDVLQQQNYKLLQGQQMLLAQNPSMVAPSMAQNQSMIPPSMGGLNSGAYAGLQQQPGMGGFMQQHLMGGADASMQSMFPGQQQLQMAQLQHFQQQQQLQQQQLQQQNAMMMSGQQPQAPGQAMMMSGQQALVDRQPGSAAKES